MNEGGGIIDTGFLILGLYVCGSKSVLIEYYINIIIISQYSGKAQFQVFVYDPTISQGARWWLETM